MYPHEQNTAKGRILNELQGGDLMDSNDVTRRMFRCWLDGSYLGEVHYRTNLEFIKGNNHDRKRMRSFVINEWCKYIAHDAGCSASYAQSIIAGAFSTDFLAKLNDALIDDAIELGADHEEAA